MNDPGQEPVTRWGAFQIEWYTRLPQLPSLPGLMLRPHD